MHITLDLNDIRSYGTFLRIKSLPKYSITGRVAWFPDEYAARIGVDVAQSPDKPFTAPAWMWDYQRDITALAVTKRKFAVFADCGLGKTGILLAFARHAAESLGSGGRVLIVSPLMVIEQTLAEASRFYGNGLAMQQVRAHDLPAWTQQNGPAIGITNYEAITDQVRQGRIGAIILDESSLLKSHYGKWGQRIIRLGRGVGWKLCLTGTPAPNDRIEFANHAVFLDTFPTVNSFLARYFVNKGQTQERWTIKPHALRRFYLDLSHWCIFLTNPATYGWKDNAEGVPPIHVHVHDVPMTRRQRTAVQQAGGDLFGTPGGITSRQKLGQIAKGFHAGRAIRSVKYRYIRDLIASWPDESTLVWCLYNREQDSMEEILDGAASMAGDTPLDQRQEMIAGFKAGDIKTLISKPKILGFGLNLQIATRQVFSGLQDSYESYYQAVKRSNRYGSIRPLNVHIPVTEIERPMIETVLSKARRVQQDAEEQEAIFKECGYGR